MMKPVRLRFLLVLSILQAPLAQIPLNSYPDFGVVSKNVDEAFLLPENPKTRIVMSPVATVNRMSASSPGY